MASAPAVACRLSPAASVYPVETGAPPHGWRIARSPIRKPSQSRRVGGGGGSRIPVRNTFSFDQRQYLYRGLGRLPARFASLRCAPLRNGVETCGPAFRAPSPSIRECSEPVSRLFASGPRQNQISVHCRLGLRRVRDADLYYAAPGGLSRPANHASLARRSQGRCAG